MKEFGIEGGVRITVHARLLGEVGLSNAGHVLSVKRTSAGLQRMSCFRCGCPRPRDRGRQPGRPVNAANGMSSSPTYREPLRRAQGGQGGQGGGVGGAPRQPRNQRDTVFSLQQQASKALKDLLGPEITAQLRVTLSQKMDPPKSAEEKLSEKKLELDKKKAHLATLDAQQTQMSEKQREHAERLVRHTAAVHECAEQVEILESEYATVE